MSLDNGRVFLSHGSGELGLVIVHEIRIGYNDLGNLDFESVGNGSSACLMSVIHLHLKLLGSSQHSTARIDSPAWLITMPAD